MKPVEDTVFVELVKICVMAPAAYPGDGFDLDLLAVVLTIVLSQDDAMHSGAGGGRR